MIHHNHGEEKIGFKPTQLNEELQKMDGEKNKKARKRKQENPKKLTINKTIKKTARGSIKEKAKQKETTVKTVKSSNTKNSNSLISAKVNLIEQIKDPLGGKFEDAFEKFEKSLGFYHNIHTYNLIRFLIYCLIKERKSLVKTQCTTCRDTQTNNS